LDYGGAGLEAYDLYDGLQAGLAAYDYGIEGLAEA